MLLEPIIAEVKLFEGLYDDGSRSSVATKQRFSGFLRDLTELRDCKDEEFRNVVSDIIRKYRYLLSKRQNNQEIGEGELPLDQT